jgi:hypothetical protein
MEVASWNGLLNIGNPADYDTWVLNFSALKEQQRTKLFSTAELRVLFHHSNFAPILLGGGRIFLIGDFTTAVQTPANAGSGAGPRDASAAATAATTSSVYLPFAELLGIERDCRPIDFRRVSRANEYNHEDVYAYLDQVVRWDYSLRIKAKDEPLGKVQKFGETNFGTCVAASFAVGPGWIIVLPSLGATSEADENYVIENFLKFRSSSAPPSWSTDLLVPQQTQIETHRDEALARAREFIAIAKSEKENLVQAERWKRLLFDGGIALEEIVREAFTVLGAAVSNPTKERADCRLVVPPHGPCVVEVKGTRGDQFGRRDLRQLNEWIDEAVSAELVEVKGAFIGNSSRDKHPEERGAMFEGNNLDYAKLKQIVSLRSTDLYCLVLLQLIGALDVKQFWKEFFQCAGEFDAANYWAVLPPEFAVRNRTPAPEAQG